MNNEVLSLVRLNPGLVPIGTGILGHLSYQGFSLVTIEKPWTFNKANPFGLPSLSCIPVGEYNLEEDGGEIFIYNDSLGISKVPNGRNRGNIRIHMARTFTDIAGGIGVGTTYQATGSSILLVNGRVAMNFIKDAIKTVGLKRIHITNEGS